MATKILRGPAEKIDGQQLANGSVSGSAMAPSSVGPLQIAPEAVTEVGLAPGSVTPVAMADDAVTAAAIAPDAVGAAELAAVSLEAEKFIRSSNYVAGEAGWAIDGSGNAEFNDVAVRGVLEVPVITGAALDEVSGISAARDPANDVSTDFSGTAPGSDPVGWSIESASDAQVIEDLDATGDRLFRVSPFATDRNRTSWTAGGTFRDVNLLVRLKFPGNVPSDGPSNTQSPGLYVRFNGTPATPGDYYFLGLGDTSALALARAGIRSRASGVISDLVEKNLRIGTWQSFVYYYVRFRAHGSLLTAKVWLASETEPEAWDLSVTDTSVESGGIALQCDGSAPAAVDVDTVEATGVTGNFNVAPSGQLWIGASNSDDAPFVVTEAGDLRVDLLQLGHTDALHIGMDSDAIQAYDAASAGTTLFLNPAGGAVDVAGDLGVGGALSTLKVGADGDSVVEKRRVTVNFNAPSVAANSGAVWDMTLPAGTTSTTAKTFFSFQEGIGNTGLVPIQAQCFAVDQVRLIVRNVTGSAVDLSARDYTFDMTIIA